jgi:protein-S-isoprenylcysteine O-methyltransferase Ste14
MKKFNDWDWRIKILGPISYSLIISGLFAYDLLAKPDSLKIAPFLLIVIGYSFMLVARFQLKDRFSIMPRAEKGIITTGIYGVIRHPVYVFSCMSTVGICTYLTIRSNNILLDIIFCLFLISYVAMQVRRAKKEEQKMIETYGDKYLKYKGKTLL